MATPILRALLPAMANALLTQWTIAAPTQTLSTVRIYGSTDPTYGSVGWTPPTDGSAFVCMYAQGDTASYPEPNRIWRTYTINCFLGIEHADTPNVAFNFNDRALAWIDAAPQVIAQNRRLAPTSLTISPILGDIEWIYDRGTIQVRHQVLEDIFYGVNVVSTLRVVQALTYQY